MSSPESPRGFECPLPCPLLNQEEMSVLCPIPVSSSFAVTLIPAGSYHLPILNHLIFKISSLEPVVRGPYANVNLQTGQIILRMKVLGAKLEDASLILGTHMEREH